MPPASPRLCQPPLLSCLPSAAGSQALAVPGAAAPTAPAGNSSRCRGLLPGGTGWAGLLLLACALGCSWPMARAMVAEAQDDEAGPPLPAPPCSCILSAPSRGSPTSPLVQSQLRAREHEGYVGSGCGHLRQPRRDGPTLRVSHRPPASTWTRAVTAKFLYCLKQSRCGTGGPKVTICAVVGGCGVSGHPRGCTLQGSRLAAAGSLGIP